MMLVVSSLLPFLLLAPFAAASLEIFSQFRQDEESCENEETCEAEKNETWSYRGCNGPKYWGIKYNMCNGKEQSPININSADAEPSENLSQLSLNNYDVPVTSARIENNGHTVQITPTDSVTRTVTVDGSTYVLRQFHFHWGNKSDPGSEHMIDGRRHTAEVHFVHTNSNDEIAVMGVLMKAVGRGGPPKQKGHHGKEHEKKRPANAAMESIAKELPNIPYKDMSTDFTSSLNLTDFLKDVDSFYRYPGSLTTPACNQGVKWIVMKKCVVFHKRELAEFLKLYAVREKDANEGCHLVNNYRPVQPLNDRMVYKSQ